MRAQKPHLASFFVATGSLSNLSEWWLLVPITLLATYAFAMRWRDDGIRRGRVLAGILLIATLALVFWPGGLQSVGSSRAQRVQAVIVDLSRSRGHRAWSRQPPEIFAAEGAERLVVIAAGRRSQLIYDGPPFSFNPEGALPAAMESAENRASFNLAGAIEQLASKVPDDAVVDLRVASDGGFDFGPLAALSKLPNFGAITIAAAQKLAPENLSLRARTSFLLRPASETAFVDIEIEVFGGVQKTRVFDLVVEGGARQRAEFSPGLPSLVVSINVPASRLQRATLGVYLAGHESFDEDRSLERVQIPIRAPKGRLSLTLIGDNLSSLAAAMAATKVAVDVSIGVNTLARADVAMVLDLDAETAKSQGIDRSLRAFVEAGGALVLGGAEQAFGLGGWTGSELEALSPLLADPGEGPQHLTVALDRSGSMARDGRFRAAARAVQSLAAQLRSRDLLQLLTFADETREATYGPNDGLKLNKDLGKVLVRGGTDLAQALDLALAESRPPKSAASLFLLSDMRDEAAFRDDKRWQAWIARAQVLKLRVFVFWFDRDERSRSKLVQLAAQTGGELIEVDDFSSLTRAFLTRSRRDLVVGPLVLPRVDGQGELSLARLLRTRARPGVRIRSAAAEDRIALASHRIGAGLVAAMPIVCDPKNLAALFGDMDSFGTWLQQFARDGGEGQAGSWSLKRRPEAWGFRLELKGLSPSRMQKAARGPARLALGSKEWPLARVGAHRYSSGILAAGDLETAEAGPLQFLRILSADGVVLGRLLPPPVRLDDRTLRPDLELSAAFLDQLSRRGSKRPPSSFPYWLLGLALLVFAVDLVFRARGR
ncbi:MAG: VWA domain-containing protein [Planctomycetota bacterium]